MKNLWCKNKKVIIVVVCISLIVGFWAGFWAGYDYKTKRVRDAFIDAFSGISDDTLTDDSVSESLSGEDIYDGHTFVSHKIGEYIKYATQTMKVNSVSSSTVLSSEYLSPEVADEGTKFIIVDHTVINNTNAPFIYMDYQLFDTEGRLYNYNNDASFAVDNYFIMRELQPEVAETGKIVFKVPLSTNSFRFGAVKGSTNEIHVVDFTVEQ